MDNNPFNPSLSHQIINNLISLDSETIKLGYKHIFQRKRVRASNGKSRKN